jgi:F0F1-type ATP synthase membrane subunit b/b'
MIELDERFWFAICFLVLVFCIYKPVKKFFINLLDSKISIIQHEFINANILFESSLKDLRVAQERFNLAILKQSSLKEDCANSLEDITNKIQSEFQEKLTKLYSNNTDIIKNSSNIYIAKIKEKILEEVLNEVESKFKINKLPISEKYQIQNILS